MVEDDVLGQIGGLAITGTLGAPPHADTRARYGTVDACPPRVRPVGAGGDGVASGERLPGALGKGRLTRCVNL